MTTAELIASVVWAVLLLAALPRVRNMWNGGDALARVERFWRRLWPYSEAALQGWLRAQMALYLAACFMAVYPAAVLFRSATPATKPVLALVTLIGITGALIMFAIAVSVLLFNAPKRFVFPSLRNQQGLLAERRRQQRGRKKTH